MSFGVKSFGLGIHRARVGTKRSEKTYEDGSVSQINEDVVADVELTLDIDIDALIAQLLHRAAMNKRGRSVVAGGAVKMKAVRR